jgi:hypothetical protein
MINLKLPPEKAILLINERIDAIPMIEKNQYGLEYYDFIRWCSKTWIAIDAIYDVGDYHPEEIRSIGLQNCSCNSHLEAQILADVYHSKLLDYIREIQDSMKITDNKNQN